MTCILIMGPPGSGKGTQAGDIAARHGVAAISTGDIFRAHVDADTPLGHTAREYMEAGEYVPDSVTIDMLRDRVDRPDCEHGFVLDGFPRTIAQVGALDELLAATGHELRAVIALDVERSELVDRLVRRAATEGRADDTEEVIRRRLALYADETDPLLAEYESRDALVRLDGSGTPAEVAERVAQALAVRA